MKKVIFLFLFISFPLLLQAQNESHPWVLDLFVGGVSFCDENGCFGPTGVAFGGTFGKSINQRFGVEGEFTFACTWENLASQIDPATGEMFISELERERIWVGGALTIRLNDPPAKNSLFAIVGVVGAREEQKEVPPEGIVPPPVKESDIRFGLSTGIGYHWWFTENWGIRPEARFYIVQDDLSALRYTGGLIRRF